MSNLSSKKVLILPPQGFSLPFAGDEPIMPPTVIPCELAYNYQVAGQMDMSRFSFFLAVALSLSFMAPAGAAPAVKAYTVNTQPLPLLVSPSKMAKTVIMIPPSSTVERANDRTYTQVFYKTPDGKVKEGWIISKYLSAVAPDSSTAKDLSAENEALKAQVAQLENESSGLSQKVKELTAKLSTLQAAYQGLKKGSAKTGLERIRKTMQTLVRENKALKLYQNIQWFLAGGFVLLLGWFLGWASTRSRKKRKQSYYL